MGELAVAEGSPALRTSVLTASEGRALTERLDALARPGVTDADRAAALAPLAERLRVPFGATAVRLRGVPVDAVDASRGLPHPTPRADAFLHAWAVASRRQPVVFAEAPAGTLFQHVFPLPTARDRPHAHGAAAIGWHVDGGGYPQDLVPDRMALLGLASDARVPTALASVGAALRTLDVATRRTLEGPHYRYRLPSAGGGVHADRFTPWVPLVRRSAGTAPVAFVFPYALPRDEAAACALSALERAAGRSAIRVQIERGDFVAWSNGAVMHARDAIPRVGLRWLKRAFAIRVTPANEDAIGADGVIRATDAVIARRLASYRG